MKELGFPNRKNYRSVLTPLLRKTNLFSGPWILLEHLLPSQTFWVGLNNLFLKAVTMKQQQAQHPIGDDSKAMGRPCPIGFPTMLLIKMTTLTRRNDLALFAWI